MSSAVTKRLSFTVEILYSLAHSSVSTIFFHLPSVQRYNASVKPPTLFGFRQAQSRKSERMSDLECCISVLFASDRGASSLRIFLRHLYAMRVLRFLYSRRPRTKQCCQMLFIVVIALIVNTDRQFH